MTDTPLVFFSFVSIPGAGPEEHRVYNKWHQLDHRPENLALPGVAWGDRWQRTAELREQSVASPEHAETDYVAMYWFREPVDQAVAAWDRLGADSFQWGRGPLLPGVRRTLLAFFRPVKGYAAASALVSPEVIPYRPNRGLHLILTRYAEPFGAAAHEAFAWEDRVLIPQLLELDGVAGAWTFTFDHHQRHGSLPLATGSSDTPGSLRIRLMYLDQEVGATVARIRQRTAALASGLAPEVAQAGEIQLEAPLRTIIPWQDW